MFTVVTPKSIQIAIDVSPPMGAGTAGACTIDIRYMSVQGRLDYLRRIADEDLADMPIIDELLIGWDGLLDEAGAHLDFNDPETRRRVLDVPWIYAAIRDAVLRELGLGQAAEKNS